MMKESAEVQIASVEERVRGASSSSSWTDPCRDLHAFRYKKVSGEFFGHNRSSSYCFQVQPVTCCDLSGFLYEVEECSIDSPKMMGNFPEILNFNRLFLKLNCFIRNYTVFV